MAEVFPELAPKFAPFFGMAGICFAMTFGCMGAAYGTAKSGIGISGVGIYRPDLIMKVGRLCGLEATWGSADLVQQSLIPVVMSGIIAVYSLVIAVLIASDINPPGGEGSYSLFNGFMHLACGLSVGLTGLAAGYAIGIVGDMGVRSYMSQSRIFVGMVLILIFGEVLGLYGLIVALILNTKSRG
ncbi:V-type proton ATPase 16 kDa proteolipid subunit [Lachnellula suecica]|uniref:V-type proton ATPase subunit c' n=1 Tax=Lachnellula suecica TaxID=602035 RepID=A0A8T9C496_9HELO|nr:V-type proton ATPase 16 kDa proteolipid subunit [Lachnellula suecica]